MDKVSFITFLKLYPSSKHRMPSYCDAMYELKKETDEIIHSPKKGKGATLRIKYYL